MSACDGKRGESAILRPTWRIAVSIAVALIGSAALADTTGPLPDQGNATPVPLAIAWPVYVIPGEPQASTLYYDGSPIVVDTEERWRLMCGSNPAGITNDDLRRFAEQHNAAMATGPVWAIESPERSRANINIIYHVDGSVPAQAVTALGVAEAYIESLFSDPITVDIYVSFADMGGGGVIGATSSSYVNTTYVASRNGLISGMDSDDVVQAYLPTGNTCPVRFTGSSDVVSQQSTIKWTRANYRAAVGSSAGSAANMQFNTQMTFDYDPSNGITLGTLSFVDVVIHETGHALGFVSAVDGGGGMQTLDLFRFQMTDGCCDYNPDTYAEFQVRPRLVSFNSPNDDHICDIISAEYRMEDGSPWQGSHFRDNPPYIGLMDPTLSDGETHYPDYFSTADKNMFDAIGYHYPPCTLPHFSQQPTNQNGCTGTTVNLSAAVDNIANPAYQWRIGTTNLVNDGVHILGATSTTLTIANLTPADTSDQYNCLVTNPADGCISASNFAVVYVYSSVTFSGPPGDQTVNEYGTAVFSVTASGEPPLSYQWRHNGVEIIDDGNFQGALTTTLIIWSSWAQLAGYYDCVVTNLCGPVASNAGHLFVNTGYGAGRGDLNCDGSVSFKDINPFVTALAAGEDGYYNAYPNCHWYNGDINADGSVSFKDINPFVALLSGK